MSYSEKVIEHYEKPNNVDVINNSPDEEPKTIEKTKRTKKDRSPAQIAAFEKCLKQRREKAELQKLKKDKELKEKKLLEEEVDEELEEENIEVKKKKVIRKKKKPIILRNPRITKHLLKKLERMVHLLS